ncbi:MAG TPA: ATP-binding protein [Sphingomonas sp.]|nr:ATP-binding protein [Sphingomonas sp.]
MRLDLVTAMRATAMPRSIRGRLIALTLALLLPAVIVTSVLLWGGYRQQRAAAEEQLAATARALSLVVDRQIGQNAILLDALATSMALARGEFDAFTQQARAANADGARWVMVTDAAGRQLVNTSPRFGGLPDRARERVAYTSLEHGVRLWNLTSSIPGRRPVVVLARTVSLEDGRLVELIVAAHATNFLKVFADQQLPQRWTGVLLDAERRIVARSRSNDLFVGRLASRPMRDRLAATSASIAPTKTLDGMPVITAWTHSPVTGWTMLIAAPRSEMAAGAWSSLVAGASFGLAMLGIGLIVSFRVGRSVALPISHLAEIAAALGRGAESEVLPSRLAEIEAVQNALHEAGTALRSRERDLQELNNNLELRVSERTRELAEATESLIQAQKMEAVGRLTGGIAHDFNNLLTAVIGSVDLLQRNDNDERTRLLLDGARQAAERGAKLTGQLLAFSRRQQLRTEAVDVGRAVDGTIELLKGTLGGATSIVRVPSAGLWPAMADPTQLDLIMLNLAINARDAMPGGGSILVETANVTVGEPARNSEEPGPGDYVTITLADRGTGMSPETLARVFDPFFTTKPVGQGTGLGLPQVLGVLKQLGGGIKIRSRPGEGTSVTIFLPRSRNEQTIRPDQSESEAVDLQGLHILLIEDDPDVRGVAAYILREAGCVVSEAENGRIGVAMLAQIPETDLVLVDFAMPGMNGAEVAAAIRPQRPELPILLMSGYADVAALSSIWDGPLISKPFTAGSLRTRIASAIRGHRVTRLRTA